MSRVMPLIKHLIKLNKMWAKILSNEIKRKKIDLKADEKLLQRALDEYFNLRRSAPRLFLDMKVEEIFHLGRAMGQAEMVLAIISDNKNLEEKLK